MDFLFFINFDLFCVPGIAFMKQRGRQLFSDLLRLPQSMHTIWTRGASVSSTGGSGIGSTVTMGGGGLPLWIPYCTQSDRRVSTTSNEFAGRGECLKV